MQTYLPAQDAATTFMGPVETAFDSTSNIFYTALTLKGTGLHPVGATLWGTYISSDANSTKPMSPVSTYFVFPGIENVMVGMEAYTVNGKPTVLVSFLDGEIITVDYATGATTLLPAVLNPWDRYVSCTELNPATQTLYLLCDAVEGFPNRSIITLDLNTGDYTDIYLQPLRNFQSDHVVGFEMVWLDSLGVLLGMYTGVFDYLVYHYPASGELSWAIDDLAQYQGADGQAFMFTQIDTPNDTWGNAAVDALNNKVYFQCSDVDSGGTSMYTTTLCQVPIYDKVKEMDYVNGPVEPYYYHYAGLQYVNVQN